MTTTTIIGRIGYHKSRPERLALIRPDGTVSNWFARDARWRRLRLPSRRRYRALQYQTTAPFHGANDKATPALWRRYRASLAGRPIHRPGCCDGASGPPWPRREAFRPLPATPVLGGVMPRRRCRHAWLGPQQPLSKSEIARPHPPFAVCRSKIVLKYIFDFGTLLDTSGGSRSASFYQAMEIQSVCASKTNPSR